MPRLKPGIESGKILTTFDDLNLIGPLCRAVADQNYTRPTAIQQKAVPAAIEGRDILGCAQTGTGKTAAFALPVLNFLGKRSRRAEPNSPFALVLAPTRELAIQIGAGFKTYGRKLKLKHALVYGGVSQRSQVRDLNHGAHILVATPGRLIDLMDQGYIYLDMLEMFVLDEADRMLDMGFLPDLNRIIRELPKRRQSLFFSATLSPKITALAKQLLCKPVHIDVTPRSRSVRNIDQHVTFMPRNKKLVALKAVLANENVDRALVFSRTKRGANSIAQKLSRSGVRATAIHGNKSQNARQRALDAFRRNHIRVLVATDVAARGIDVDGITHVINYDIPDEPESYVHRIGRTGRAGASGTALAFCSPSERKDLKAIEKLIGKKVPTLQFDRSIAEAQANLQARTEESGVSGSPPERRRPAAGAAKSIRRKKRRSRRSNASNAIAAEGARQSRRPRKQRPGKNARRRAKQAG